jgi:hypothetical protein
MTTPSLGPNAYPMPGFSDRPSESAGLLDGIASDASAA